MFCMALTDVNSTAGTLDYIRLAEKYGVKPVVGIDFRNGADQQFVALAKNNRGFMEINKYLSGHLHQHRAIPAEAPPFNDAFVIYPFLNRPQRPLMDHEFIGLKHDQLIKLNYTSLSAQLDKLVVLQPVTFRNKKDFNAHRLLRAIDNNTLLSKLSRSEEALPDEQMLPPEQLEACFKGFPRIMDNTREIWEQCDIHFGFGDRASNQNISTYTGGAASDDELIRKLCCEGLAYRYGDNPSQAVIDRMNKELDVIRQRDFISYFLINWDIVTYARNKNYFYVGRGSGANSLVAYLLRITDVDPMELDLYFERFINPARKNPPDFDIDFSWKERQDVTRYIFERFPGRTALMGAQITFKRRSMVREIGKVLGLPPREIDKLNSSRLDISSLDEISRLVLTYSKYIEQMPSHLSVHSSGVIVLRQDVHYYGATIMPPKGFQTSHFDMYIAEDVGIHKLDILGQRGLAKIKDALEVIRINEPRSPEIDIHDIPKFKEDDKIKSLLMEGKAMGCFYVESPAMRMLMKKLRVNDYLGLVAASSVIRPGVAQSGMMQEYIKRYRDPSTRKYIHPKLGELMKETFGVMVYQEDVLKVAHYFAGLTLSEADILRRGMSWKFRERNEFGKVRDKFFSNCRAFGYKKEVVEEVWRQIESFANYAFAKGHSASYAVESYQSLYLKAYYPLEYMVATINNFGGFYRTEIYLHEARMNGGRVHAPCINRSFVKTAIYGKDIFLGFQHVKDLDSSTVMDMVCDRVDNGPFLSLRELVNRVEVSLDSLIMLIRVGAFRSLNRSKKELLWDAHFLLGKKRKSDPAPELFPSDSSSASYELPELDGGSLEEDAYDELELLGFTLTSPFELTDLDLSGLLTVADLPANIGRVVEIPGYLVNVKYTTTRGGGSRTMYFGTFIDVKGEFLDTVHFPVVAERYPFKGRGCYTIKGKVVEEFEYLSIEVHEMHKVPMKESMLAEISGATPVNNRLI